ncbi:MAG: outer membrane beta-barrel protein [Cyclobacteriaceae bacterium]
MKKLLLILLVSFGTINFLQAQNDRMIKFKLGASEPIGSYGATTNNAQSGYAETGWNAGIEGVYYLNDWFGLGGNVTYSYPNFDNRIVNNGLLESAHYSVNSSGNYYDNFTYTVGPYFRYTVTDQVSVHAKTHVGVLTVYRPDVFITYDIIRGDTWGGLYLDNTWDNSPAINLGLGVQYMVSDNIGINLDWEYTNGSPNFAYWSKTEPSIILRDERRVSFANFDFGVSYYFW